MVSGKPTSSKCETVFTMSPTHTNIRIMPTKFNRYKFTDKQFEQLFLMYSFTCLCLHESCKCSELMVQALDGTSSQIIMQLPPWLQPANY